MDLELFLATITVDHFPFFVQCKLAEQVSYCNLSMWYSFSASTEASAPAVLSFNNDSIPQKTPAPTTLMH